MKLLFDENLSPRLVASLSTEFPGSAHVRDVGLESAMDSEVLGYAKAQGFVIVSKDSDFRQMSFLLGAPPKVVWIRRGNCPTALVEAILREKRGDIAAFEKDPEGAFLALG